MTGDVVCVASSVFTRLRNAPHLTSGTRDIATIECPPDASVIAICAAGAGAAMLTWDEFPRERCSSTVTYVIPRDTLIATSPNFRTTIVTLIPQALVCGLIVTRLDVSQGEGRAAQQQQGRQHDGVRRDKHEEHVDK